MLLNYIATIMYTQLKGSASKPMQAHIFQLDSVSMPGMQACLMLRRQYYIPFGQIASYFVSDRPLNLAQSKSFFL